MRDGQPGFRPRFITRRAVIRLGVAAILLAVIAPSAWWSMFRMPGESYRGDLPPLTAEQAALGNLAAETPGADRPQEIVVVGGHYDSVIYCPGANDNATGVAATLALARTLKGFRPSRTLRFVCFVNEEPPYFQTADMGSRVYAGRCRQRGEKVTAMICLETIGYYTDEKGSQRYPAPFSLLYPATGNFIAFVGNYGSRRLVRQVVGSFRQQAEFPSEGAAVPGFLPGIGWSDHWSFWQEGYPALMVTDTAPFRYPHYHRSSDTPDKIDYKRMARVVSGLEAVVKELAGPAE